MKVSIALATYNGERYLQEQLNSFLHQTRLPDEIIACDDCSTDRTMDILESFAKSAPFAVHIYRNAINLGYTKNFERAIGLCSGDVIFLSDQDDVWFPEKIEVVLNTFRSKKGALVVINDAKITDEYLKPTNITVMEQFHSANLSDEFFVSGCCTAIKSEFVPLILPIPSEYFAFDGWIHRISCTLNCRVSLSQPLQFQRRHADSTSYFYATDTKPATILNKIIYYCKYYCKLRKSSQSHQEMALKRLEGLKFISNYLVKQRIEIERCLGKNIKWDTIMNDIRMKQEAAERRLALLKKNRFLRLPTALMMLLRGDYRYFMGWISFIGDLIR